MSTIANIVLKDGASTPAKHTFVPVGSTGNVTTYSEIAVNPYSDRPNITATIRPASASNEGHKTRWRLALPHPLSNEGGCCVDTSNPPVGWFTIETMVNKSLTADEINTLVAFLQNLVQETQFVETVKGQGLW